MAYAMNAFCTECGEGVAALTPEALERVVREPCFMCGGQVLSSVGQRGIPGHFPPVLTTEQVGQRFRGLYQGESMQNPGYTVLRDAAFQPPAVVYPNPFFAPPAISYGFWQTRPELQRVANPGYEGGSEAEQARIRAGGSSLSSSCRQCGCRIPRGQAFCSACRPLAPSATGQTCKECRQWKPANALQCPACGAEDEWVAYAEWTQRPRANPGSDYWRMPVGDIAGYRNPPPPWRIPTQDLMGLGCGMGQRNPYDPGYAAYPLTAFRDAGPIDLSKGGFHGNPPHGPHEVWSELGLEGVFPSPEAAARYAQELRGIGATTYVRGQAVDSRKTHRGSYSERLRQQRGHQNPPRSKKCQLGYHDWAPQGGKCRRSGCEAFDEPAQDLMFGVDPEIAAERERRRLASGGQDELFGRGTGAQKNPRKGTCAFCRGTPATCEISATWDPNSVRFACDSCANRFRSSPGYKVTPFAKNPGGRTLEDSAEAWAHGLGLQVPRRGSAAHRGLMAAWQRSVGSQNPLTSGKARTILRDGKVRGRKLSKKQKRFFGAIAGGQKPWSAARKKEFARRMKAARSKKRGRR